MTYGSGTYGGGSYGDTQITSISVGNGGGFKKFLESLPEGFPDRRKAKSKDFDDVQTFVPAWWAFENTALEAR